MNMVTVIFVAANIGCALFFGVVLTSMLLFGGAFHQISLFEPSQTVISLEVAVVWGIVVFDAAWILHMFRRQKPRAIA